MMSVSFLRNTKVFLAAALALAFLAVSLPQNYQAQDGVLGPTVKEVEPNDGGSTAPPQRIPFPSVVEGSRGGNLDPAYLVFPTEIPPIVSPLTGDVVGSPRTTQVIVFANVFTDATDLYRFSLTAPTNVAITLEGACGAHYLSGDAQVAAFGGFLGTVRAPQDLDLILLDSRSNFVDGSFNGPGFCLTLGSIFTTPGCNCVPTREFIPNSTAPGSFLSGLELPRGTYFANVDDFNGAIVTLLTVSPGQNVLTNRLVTLWEEDSETQRYILRFGDRGVNEESGTEELAPVEPKAVKFEYGFMPAQKVRGAADNYYSFQVIDPGTYTINLTMAGSERRNTGRLHLLQYNETTRRWIPVGHSTVVGKTLESLADVQLEAGRYVIAVQQEGIKPIGKKFNYGIGVLDENGELAAFQVSRPLPTAEQIRRQWGGVGTTLGDDDKDSGSDSGDKDKTEK
jgi:hypothetical protein